MSKNTFNKELSFFGGLIVKRLMNDLQEDFTEDQAASILATMSTMLLNDVAVREFIISSREALNGDSDDTEEGG